jgi:hypothetical protein
VTEWVLIDDGIVSDGAPVSLRGLDPWKQEWVRLDEPAITVSHPQYPAQRHKMPIYEMRDGDTVVKFAAGEFSNGAWGFYLPR